MATSSQGQQFDKSQEQIKKHKWFSRKPLLIVTIVIAAIIITIVWLLSSLAIIPTLWASILSAILTILGVLVTVLSLIASSHRTEQAIVPQHVSLSPTPPIQPQSRIIQFNPSPTVIQQSLAPTTHSVSPSVDSTTNQHYEHKIKNVEDNLPTYRKLQRVDWGEAPHLGNFYGRKNELTVLKDWIEKDHCQLVAVLGMGGVGKTALVAKLVEQMENRFEYIFWRSLQNAPPIENILKNCIQFFSDQQQSDLPFDVDDQITLLIEHLRVHRCLIVLDNVESILQGGNRPGQYRSGYEGYGRLFQRVGEAQHHSCLLLTSREKLKEMVHLEGETSPVRSLALTGVGQAEGQELLRDKGLFGPDEKWADLIRLYAGNPLALKLVSEAIREVFGGNIAEFLKEGEAVFGDIQDLLDQHFNRLSEREREVMYWMAIEREGISLDELREDMVPAVSKKELLQDLDILRRRSMIETGSITSFTLQPVIMEYVTDHLIEQVYKEIDAKEIRLFGSLALIKAQVKDYVRDTQVLLILMPIAERLLNTFGQAESVKKLNSGVNPIYHTSGKVNISFLGHMPSQTRQVADSPNLNGVASYYTHLQ